MTQHDQHLTDRQVAALLSISRPTVWRWTKTLQGFPAPRKIGPNTSRWKKSDIDRFLDQKTTG